MALLAFAVTFLRAYFGEAYDLIPIWNGVHAFINHQPVYLTADDTFPSRHGYPYPPSSLLLLAPLGLVDLDTAKIPFLILITVMILGGGALCLRLFGLRWQSVAGVILLLGLSLWIAVRQTLWLDNVDGLILAGEVGALLAASRRRWLLAGFLLGLAFAIKPSVLPLLLLPLMYRQWAAAALAIAVPSALSMIAIPFTADPAGFFTGAIPFLLQGNSPGPETQVYNVSLSVLTAWGLPAQLVLLLRLAVLGGTAILLWLRWKAGGDEALRLSELTGLIMLATLLGFSYSFERYALWLLPLLVSVVHPAAAMRSWIAWLGIYGMGSPDGGHVWSQIGWLGDRWQVRVTAGLLLILVALGISIVRRHRSIAAAGQTHRATPLDTQISLPDGRIPL